MDMKANEMKMDEMKMHMKHMRVTSPEDVKFSPVDPNDKEGKGPQISVVFGDIKKKGPAGFLLKLPAGYKPGPHTHSSDDYAVVVKGVVHNFPAGGDTGEGVAAGGTWYQPANQPHDNWCEEGSDCVLFVYVPKGFDVKPVKAPKAKTASAR
jgi:quercetin dioxygenase-like cupin family protein